VAIRHWSSHSLPRAFSHWWLDRAETEGAKQALEESVACHWWRSQERALTWWQWVACDTRSLQNASLCRARQNQCRREVVGRYYSRLYELVRISQRFEKRCETLEEMHLMNRFVQWRQWRRTQRRCLDRVSKAIHHWGRYAHIEALLGWKWYASSKKRSLRKEAIGYSRYRITLLEASISSLQSYGLRRAGGDRLVSEGVSHWKTRRFGVSTHRWYRLTRSSTRCRLALESSIRYNRSNYSTYVHIW